MVPNGGIATICKRARASITNPSNVIWISTEIPGCNFGHETAMVVPDNLPYNLVLLHLLSINYVACFSNESYFFVGRDPQGLS